MKYINISALHLALVNDCDLSGMELNSLPQIMQTLFVCTGCDYVPFFSGLGKATILRYFFCTHILHLGQMQMAHFQIYVTIRGFLWFREACWHCLL